MGIPEGTIAVNAFSIGALKPFMRQIEAAAHGLRSHLSFGSITQKSVHSPRGASIRTGRTGLLAGCCRARATEPSQNLWKQRPGRGRGGALVVSMGRHSGVSMGRHA